MIHIRKRDALAAGRALNEMMERIDGGTEMIDTARLRHAVRIANDVIYLWGLVPREMRESIEEEAQANGVQLHTAPERGM